MPNIVKTAKGSKIHRLEGESLYCANTGIDFAFFPLRLPRNIELKDLDNNRFCKRCFPNGNPEEEEEEEKTTELREARRRLCNW